jgi:integrase/recombinase XerC/integrase/recombinase XerD
MAIIQAEQTLSVTSVVDDDIRTWLQQFLKSRDSTNYSPNTRKYYEGQFKYLLTYCDAQVITKISQLTPVILRDFLEYLECSKHNPGGRRACFRAVRAFLLWWENEVEPEGWKNPIRKVKCPKVPKAKLKPIHIEMIQTLLDSCEKGLAGTRDRAIILTLVDSGVRASELIGVDLDDVDLISGRIHIRHGKGDKERNVYVEATTRKAIRRYLVLRQDMNPALWITLGTNQRNERLTYWGLRHIIRRRCEQVGLPMTQLHSYRRTFALESLRGGANIYALKELMGHEDLKTMICYLDQIEEDRAIAHLTSSPVERYKLK